MQGGICPIGLCIFGSIDGLDNNRAVLINNDVDEAHNHCTFLFGSFTCHLMVVCKIRRFCTDTSYTSNEPKEWRWRERDGISYQTRNLPWKLVIKYLPLGE